MPGLDPRQHEEPSRAVPISNSKVHVRSLRPGHSESDSVLQWNTTNLGWRLGADLTSAASASAMVAPVICVIDRYVFMLMLEERYLGSSISTALSPT